MARIRILLALAIAICAIGATTAASATASSPQSQMMHKVNHYRHKYGLHAVKFSSSLKHSAGRYARWMMRHHYFGHSSRIHASSRYRRLGEILEAQRGGSNVSLAFHTWMRSGPHRAIILDRSFKYAGAGLAHGWYRGHKSTFWVMHFGTP
jgi:uncharacterized protein YkwD